VIDFMLMFKIPNRLGSPLGGTRPHAPKTVRHLVTGNGATSCRTTRSSVCNYCIQV